MNDKNIKHEYEDRVDFIFKSICEEWNLERMLLNEYEEDEFKQSIQNGLNKYNKWFEDMLDKMYPKIVSLNKKRYEIVKNALKDVRNWYRDGCDCGDWIVYLEDLGYFTLSTHCHKSSYCSNDKLWDIDEVAYIYDKNIYEEGYNWECISLECEIDRNQVKELVYIANETIKELKGYDEYGE